MGIDISKIENQRLKDLAKSIDGKKTKDGTKNNEIIDDGVEIILFEQEATTMVDDLLVADDDFNQAMGLYVSNPIVNTRWRNILHNAKRI